MRDRGDWQRLVVKWRVALRVSSKIYKGLSLDEKKRARLTAFLQALETGAVPSWARLSYLEWSNPDADWEPEPVEDQDGILTHLPSLNRGNWLATHIAHRLNTIGGLLHLETSKRKEKSKRKARRKGKGLGKGKRKTRKVSKVGTRGRVPRTRKDNARSGRKKGRK